MKFLNHFFNHQKHIKTDPGNIFIFSDTTRPNKYNITCKGTNNQITIGQHCKCNNLSINISGQNNKIVIGNNLFAPNGALSIVITGDKNTIVLSDDICIYSRLDVYNHANTIHGNIQIGAHTSFYKTEIHNYDNDATIIIGTDCMFAYNTVVYNTDGHTILINDTIMNRAKQTTIGNHVWVAAGAEILKNSTISDGSIVARRALVSGTFNEPNCILAGIPARIIKQNINWDRRHPNEFERESNAQKI